MLDKSILVILFIVVIALLFVGMRLDMAAVVLGLILGLLGAVIASDRGFLKLSSGNGNKIDVNSNNKDSAQDAALIDAPSKLGAAMVQSDVDAVLDQLDYDGLSSHKSYQHGLIDGDDHGPQSGNQFTALQPSEYTMRYGTPYEGEYAGGDRFTKWYFGGWGQNPKYSNCYRNLPGGSSCGNTCGTNVTMGAGPIVNDGVLTGRYRGSTVDERMIHGQLERSRDKRAIDGWVSKNANYYKKNFGGEFDEFEQRPWWGNDEF